ncbi:MAG: hypothetical protein ABIQ56_01520 [Chitinophagaceae bacterium]
MKWIRISTYVACIMLVFASCKKSDLQSSPNMIMGRWQIESNVFNEYYNYQNHESVFYGRPNDYFDFRQDGYVVISNNGYVENLRYTFSSDNRLNIDGEVFEIRSLTNTQMILYNRKHYSVGEYDENTYYLYRY